MLPIHLGAVVVAAVAAFIIGFLFHGPLFGKIWMRLANIHPTGKEKFSDMIPQMIGNFLVNIVTAYALAVVYLFASSTRYVIGTPIHIGLVSGLLVWLGFLVTSSSIEVIWMGRSKSLWLFEAVSSLCVMLAMGAIIAHW
jgi:energy-converting hydrogenase Eha subunit B